MEQLNLQDALAKLDNGECPLCPKIFKDGRGSRGHLQHSSDPAHRALYSSLYPKKGQVAGGTKNASLSAGSSGMLDLQKIPPLEDARALDVMYRAQMLRNAILSQNAPQGNDAVLEILKVLILKDSTKDNGSELQALRREMGDLKESLHNQQLQQMTDLFNSLQKKIDARPHPEGWEIAVVQASEKLGSQLLQASHETTKMFSEAFGISSNHPQTQPHAGDGENLIQKLGKKYVEAG